MAMVVGAGTVAAAVSDVVGAAFAPWVSGTQLSWTPLRVAVVTIKAGPAGVRNLRRSVMRGELWSLVWRNSH